MTCSRACCRDRPIAAGAPSGSRLESVGAVRHGGLAVGRLVLVDDALARGLVEQPGGAAEGGLRARRVPAVGRLAELADGGLELRLHGLVAQAATLVLPDALDLRLDVGHASSTPGSTSRNSALKATSRCARPANAARPHPAPPGTHGR